MSIIYLFGSIYLLSVIGTLMPAFKDYREYRLSNESFIEYISWSNGDFDKPWIFFILCPVVNTLCIIYILWLKYKDSL